MQSVSILLAVPFQNLNSIVTEMMQQEKFVLLDMDFTLVNSFTRGESQWNYQKLNRYVSRMPDFKVGSELFWIRPGIEQLLKDLKDKGCKLVFWTSRPEHSARPVFDCLPFKNLFSNCFFGEREILTETRLKSVKKLRDTHYPNHSLSQFILIDDDEENIKFNKNTSIHIFRYLEWGWDAKSGYDDHIQKNDACLRDIKQKIFKYFNIL